MARYDLEVIFDVDRDCYRATVSAVIRGERRTYSEANLPDWTIATQVDFRCRAEDALR